MRNKERFGWKYRNIKEIKFSIYKEILQISIPTALEYFLWNASNMVLMSFLNGINYYATAIYTLTFGIEIIIYMVYDGTGKAAMTLIGQEIGAKDYKSADGYIKGCIFLTLQRLKHVGFLYTFTSKYTRKHIRLMNFYKTFTTKDTFVSISDSIRLVSKPVYISCV